LKNNQNEFGCHVKMVTEFSVFTLRFR